MKKELRFPLFILGLGLFISLYALTFTGNDFSFWIGGMCIGDGVILTGLVLNRAKVKR